MAKKILLHVGMPFISLVSILLIPFNIFVHSFPIWIVWADVAVLISCTVYNLFTLHRVLPKVISVVVGVIISVLLLFAAYCCPYWNSVTFSGGFLSVVNDQVKEPSSYDREIGFADAKSDIDQTMKTLRSIHPAFIKGVPENIAAAYEESIRCLEQNDRITVTDVRREISRIMALLGDGHTSVSYLGSALYLNDAITRSGEGWELIEIDGTPIDTVIRQSLSLFSYESENQAVNTIYNMTRTSSGLGFLGFDPFDLEMTWTKDGKKESVKYSADDFASENVQSTAETEGSTLPPVKFVSYSIDKENDLATLTLKECTCNDEYKNCVRDFFTEVKNNGIGNVAVDLRSNPGGNSLVANEFIRYLPIDSYNISTYRWRWGPFRFGKDKGVCENEPYEDLTFDGNVFVLTDTITFSSATLFASSISDNNLGTVIGEASSNSLNSFGEISIFQLEKSGLLIRVSTKAFLRADQSKGDFVIPDIECPAADAPEVLKEHIGKQ